MLNFLKNNWLLILALVVIVWILAKKKKPAPSGSIAGAVDNAAGTVNQTIADLSRAWANIRGDLGFPV